jgi:hypothetical protein
MLACVVWMHKRAKELLSLDRFVGSCDDENSQVSTGSPEMAYTAQLAPVISLYSTLSVSAERLRLCRPSSPRFVSPPRRDRFEGQHSARWDYAGSPRRPQLATDKLS